MNYLRSKLVVAQTDVSNTKISLDTSVSATSNMDRREYIGKRLAVLFQCEVSETEDRIEAMLEHDLALIIEITGVTYIVEICSKQL